MNYHYYMLLLTRIIYSLYLYYSLTYDHMLIYYMILSMRYYYIHYHLRHRARLHIPQQVDRLRRRGKHRDGRGVNYTLSLYVYIYIYIYT